MDKNNPERSELGKPVNKEIKNSGKNKLSLIIIIAIIVIISLIIFLKISSTLNRNTNNANNFIDNNVTEKKNASGKLNDESTDMVEETQKTDAVTAFNNRFKRFDGTQNGVKIKSMLTFVSFSNRRNRVHKITVTYGETSTLEPEEIISLRDSFNDGSNYEVALNYDENGYVNSATIK